MVLTGKTLRKRIHLLSWLLPLSFSALTVLYQLGMARWVQDHFSNPLHYGIEILFYGTTGPLFAFWALRMIGRWIDEKEDAEKHARASDRRLASITNVSADAILSLNQRGEIITWNPGAVGLFGCPAEQVQGQPFSALMGGGKAQQAEFHWIEEMVRRVGSLRGHETVCYDLKRKAIHVELTAIRLEDEQEQPSGLFIILRDISSRREREAEIRQLNENLNEQVTARTRELGEKIEQLAQANTDLQRLDQMRSEFVSLVSHQLRAPLTNMNGAVEHIRVGCGVQSPTCERMLEILGQQTTRLERLVDGVLSTTRIEAGELPFHPEPLSLLPLVQQVADQFSAGKAGRRIHLANKPGLPLVLADRDRVAEVLTNLLDNADKYSLPFADVFISLWADETDVAVSVRDQGPGLPPGAIKRVFEKFYRLDSSDSQSAYGYGLGLYLCSKLVEAQGGHIWAENHPEGGAVFSFSLPVWNQN